MLRVPSYFFLKLADCFPRVVGRVAFDEDQFVIRSHPRGAEGCASIFPLVAGGTTTERRGLASIGRRKTDWPGHCDIEQVSPH